jgi:predicted enzyme related to lactoylglutathione lyase
MEMKLELVPIPVADVDRAKTFYIERFVLLKTSTCSRRRASGSCS